MFCPKCGAQVEDQVAFCTSCGAPMQSNGNNQPQTSPLNTNQQPMKWFKFLIYFGLFAGVVLNAVSGFQLLTGAHYGEGKDLVYQVFGNLQTLDLIGGICLVALAAFGIYTRVRLAGYYKNGPQMLAYLYLGAVIANVVYIAGLYIVVPEVAGQLDLTSTISSCVTSVIMVIVNREYFRKREALFVNQ